MTRATIAGIAAAAVLGAGAVTAVALPALTAVSHPTAGWHGAMHSRLQGPPMMGATPPGGMMGGTGWMTPDGMHGGMMRGWSR